MFLWLSCPQKSPYAYNLCASTYPFADNRRVSSSPGAVLTDGPLKTLNNFQTDDPVESEMHDPIARPVLTQGEAYVMIKL